MGFRFDDRFAAAKPGDFDVLFEIRSSRDVRYRVVRSRSDRCVVAVEEGARDLLGDWSWFALSDGDFGEGFALAMIEAYDGLQGETR